MIAAIAAVLLARDATLARAAVACPARDESDVTWILGPVTDRDELDRWCRAVGPPIYVPAVPQEGGAFAPPALRDLVILTWNTHLARGDLPRLIADLRGGRWTGGEPVTRFVLLLQEVFRRGHEVPEFAGEARSAFAITARDPQSADAAEHARTLGLSLLYVPSMRNGGELREDRGNAIVSTEPLGDPVALELPLERQRRVAVAATVGVALGDGAAPLRVLNVHLEPLSAPRAFWVFHNPRRRQLGAILDALRTPVLASAAGDAGTVVGGDFNTIQGGAGESVYGSARAWSKSLASEDRRATHQMGRLDYLFFDLADGRTAATQRLDEKYGSDHHPVLGRFVP